jgi:hypothetical protein
MNGASYAMRSQRMHDFDSSTASGVQGEGGARPYPEEADPGIASPGVLPVLLGPTAHGTQQSPLSPPLRRSAASEPSRYGWWLGPD